MRDRIKIATSRAVFFVPRHICDPAQQNESNESSKMADNLEMRHKRGKKKKSKKSHQKKKRMNSAFQSVSDATYYISPVDHSQMLWL